MRRFIKDNAIFDITSGAQAYQQVMDLRKARMRWQSEWHDMTVANVIEALSSVPGPRSELEQHQELIGDIKQKLQLSARRLSIRMT